MEVHVIKVPAPKEVGKVNCILLDVEKPVLIDPGPNTEDAFNAVLESLDEHDIDVEDIEKVLVTHPHSDHFGNAQRIKNKSGADICMHEDAAEIVENFKEYKHRQVKFFSDYLTRMGVQQDEIEDALDQGLPNTYDTDLEVDNKLYNGDKISSGSTSIECVRVEGHAKGSICFKLESQNLVFTGDFILPDITPNPMLMLPEEGDQPPSSLKLYLSSLKSFDAPRLRGYGGHEGLIENINDRIEEILRHHKERKEDMFEDLTEEMTAFQLMKKFFGDLPKNQYYLGMAETVSHLRLLEDEERINRKEKDSTVFFSRA